jgi:hypothetical protein
MIQRNGNLPTNFNLCKIRPIAKDFNKPNSDINNNRPISISNSIAQIFERLILNRNYRSFDTSNNQFGFKKTIIEYIEKHTECYLISLDAEKVFDKFWRNGLFYKLKERLPKRDWLILKKYYDSSMAEIICNGEVSDAFRVVTGVKQGGVLSPFLFNIYIYELIDSIIKLKIGAKIGAINTNIISYCDDIYLLFSSPKHGQVMLNKSDEFAEKWRIKFNPNKSNAIVFGKPVVLNASFYLRNEVIKYKEKLKII